MSDQTTLRRFRILGTTNPQTGDRLRRQVDDLPPAIKEAADRVEEIAGNWYDTRAAAHAAEKALEAAPDVDAAADATAKLAGKDLPKPTEPQRREEWQRAVRIHKATEAQYREARQDLSRAIADEPTFALDRRKIMAKKAETILRQLRKIEDEFHAIVAEADLIGAANTVAEGVAADFNATHVLPKTSSISVDAGFEGLIPALADYARLFTLTNEDQTHQ